MGQEGQAVRWILHIVVGGWGRKVLVWWWLRLWKLVWEDWMDDEDDGGLER